MAAGANLIEINTVNTQRIPLAGLDGPVARRLRRWPVLLALAGAVLRGGIASVVTRLPTTPATRVGVGPLAKAERWLAPNLGYRTDND